MRILFSGVPQYGHLLPLLPLATAARAAGHDVALVTSATLAEAVAPLLVLAAGPDMTQMGAEHLRREQGEATDAGADDVGRRFLFGTRVDLTADAAICAARDFEPDLLVAEPLDAVGPVVAAALGIPWAVHAFGPTSTEMVGMAPSVALQEVMEDAVGRELVRRGLVAADRIAYLDPCPELLQPAGWTPVPERIVVRPQAYSGTDSRRSASVPVDRQERVSVAVTLGTVTVATIGDPGLLDAVLRSISSTAALDVDVVATLGPAGGSVGADVARDRLRVVDFVPLGDLLEGVDVVVSVAGIGTVLAALCRGIPLVLMPVLWDQPFNARQAAATGAAVVVGSPQDVGAAVADVLGNPRFRAAAQAVAVQIATMDPPERAVDVLADRVTALRRGAAGGVG